MKDWILCAVSISTIALALLAYLGWEVMHIHGLFYIAMAVLLSWFNLILWQLFRIYLPQFPFAREIWLIAFLYSLNNLWDEIAGGNTKMGWDEVVILALVIWRIFVIVKKLRNAGKMG